jgi:DNA-binding SARP family transcriptional activator
VTRLVVRLLGGFRVELGGAPVYDFETDKARALLAYLVVEADRPHRREILASLLWPDRPDPVARKSLRQALFRLRQALRDHQPPYFIFASPTDIQFNIVSDYTLDVAELEAYSKPAGKLELLPAALCADFLAGFSVPDSEPFQAWALSRQERYHQLVLEVLDRQNAAFEAARDYEQAIAAARLQLQLEPWLEEAHRRCMRSLALAGRCDEALRQFDACYRALADELGVEPAAATTELVADIRAGRGGFKTRPLSPPQRSPGRPPLAHPPPGQPHGLPLLVAREDELGELAGHLERALAGETSVVFVSGDAGSGKTALLEAFAALAMAKHPDLLVASARCNPDGSLNPFAPLRRVAEMLFGDLRSEVAWRVHGPDQLHRLQAATGLTLASLDEYGPDLAGTLIPAMSVARRAEPVGSARGRPTGGRNDALTQDVLFDQLVCTLAAIAREQPLLLLFDDLHWVDDATAAFLVHLGRELGGSCPAPSRSASGRLLVLGAYRTATVALGRRDSGSGETLRHPLAIAVNELSRIQGDIVVELDRADGRAFVEAYLDIEPNRLRAPFRDALFSQTGGHPLFALETLRNLQDRGELHKDEAGRWVARDSLDWGRLPARVEAAIAERIDRLPEREHRILSAASAQGDDFTGELVAELTGMPAQEVLACLSSSLARQHHLVVPQGVQRAAAGQPASAERVRSVYRFTHHLFQKYLYDQLDPVERGQLHAGIAASLDREAGADPTARERLAARLAWHYEAGDFPLQAARALHNAGRQAMRLSAFREALDCFDHGLALLGNEPPSAERTEVERMLHIARLNPQRTLSGVGSAGVKSALDEAAGTLAANETGQPAFTVLLGQASLLLAGGQYDESQPVFERIEAEATQCGDGVFAALAHLGLGFVHHARGELGESERHLACVLGHPASERAAEMRAVAAVDPVPLALVVSALNLWCLGYPEAALARSRQALAGAVAGGDTIGQAYAAAVGLLLLLLFRDEAALQELSDQCYRLSLQHGFEWWRSFAEVFVGRRMVLEGEAAAGVAAMRSGLAGWQSAGLSLGSATLVVVLADTCLSAAGRRPPGRDSEGPDGGHAALLASALVAIGETIGPGKTWPTRVFPCELYRLRGELLLERDGLAMSAEALQCFDSALGLAHERGLLALELRAAISIVRLRTRLCTARQGDADAHELAEARRCLAEIYGRFTEGFDLPDLQDAAALICRPGVHASSSNNALASSNSTVSGPSANQP